MARLQRWAILAILLKIHLTNDVVVGYMWAFGLNDNWNFVIFALAGICAGQFNLVAIWSALAEGRLILRLPWSLLLATLIWYALVIGNRIASLPTRRAMSFGEAVTLGVVLLAGLVVVQLPLWFAGKGFGWRLTSPSVPGDSAEQQQQFNIGHLLLGTGLIAVTLALGRFVLPVGGYGGFTLHHELPTMLMVIGIVNLAVTLPCIWGAFADYRIVLVGLFAWPVYCLAVTGVEFAALVAMLGSPGGEDHLVLLMFGIFNLTQCLSVFGTLLLLRAVGFRFVRRGRQHAIGKCDPATESATTPKIP